MLHVRRCVYQLDSQFLAKNWSSTFSPFFIFILVDLLLCSNVFAFRREKAEVGTYSCTDWRYNEFYQIIFVESKSLGTNIVNKFLKLETESALRGINIVFTVKISNGGESQSQLCEASV